MRTARLIDAEEEDRAILVAQLHAYVSTVNRAGPVGDAVGIDLAAQDSDRG